MMKSIDWSEDLRVHVRPIDGQLEEHYASMNAVLGAVKEIQTNRIMEYPMQGLGEHTATQCHNEEALMTAWRYPGFEHQKKEHDYFSREIGSTRQNFEKGVLWYDKLADTLSTGRFLFDAYSQARRPSSPVHQRDNHGN